MGNFKVAFAAEGPSVRSTDGAEDLRTWFHTFSTFCGGSRLSAYTFALELNGGSVLLQRAAAGDFQPAFVSIRLPIRTANRRPNSRTDDLEGSKR